MQYVPLMQLANGDDDLRAVELDDRLWQALPLPQDLKELASLDVRHDEV